MPGAGADVRSAWLAAQVARVTALDRGTALHDLTEAMSLATGEAVTVRRLAADGRLLVPVAVHHPDAELRLAMRRVTARTTEARDVGLWRVALDEGRTVVFPVPPEGPLPAAASAEQREFLTRWPVRSVAGTPVRFGADLVGGVSLVRFLDVRPFTPADLTLLEEFAAWVAPSLAAVRPDAPG